MITSQQKCRICGCQDLIEVTNLGNHALSCRFPFKTEPTPLIAPLVLVKCNDMGHPDRCGLVQLKHNVTADELYQHNYGYRSGLNATMPKHLGGLTQELLARTHINQGDLILDIGSNDSTLLRSYPFDQSMVTYLGIDPTGPQFRQFYPDYVQLIPDFFTAQTFTDHFPDRKAKLVTSIAMFYDLPSPMEFMADIKKVLAPDGLWVTEQSYIISMLETVSFDTICHEHLEYYALKQIQWMADHVGLQIIDVTRNDSNGGSFRLTLTHQGSTYYSPNCPSIDAFAKYEETWQLDTRQPYTTFNQKTEEMKSKLTTMIQILHENDRKIYLYGASTKGNTLLQYFGLDRHLITAAAERNVEKYGRRTPQTDIPIISEQEMRTANPDVLLVLPWHFKKEFVEREQTYLSQGGIMIFPMPTYEIYSHKKRALVFGGQGQIGTYLCQKLKDRGYEVFSVDRERGQVDGVFFVKGDICDHAHVKTLISAIVPDEIYNLASPTTIDETIADPLGTFKTNIESVTFLCELLRTITPCPKLFNACSSEMYRGLVTGDNLEVKFNEETPCVPISPYGISKTASYHLLRFYRQVWNLPFYTGIFCNAISSRLKQSYLLPRVVHHVLTQPLELLTLGNIDLVKDFSHSSDIAEAVILAVSGPPTDYVISSGHSYNLRTMISLIYKELGYSLEWRDDQAYDIETSHLMVVSDPERRRSYEKKGEKITGDNTKISQLGWKPQYDIQAIISELIGGATAPP
jgi:NDP-4-keto-2,6-dideoxyhexose 3-C-methyltransferase